MGVWANWSQSSANKANTIKGHYRRPNKHQIELLPYFLYKSGLIWIVMHSDKGRGYYWLTSSPSDVKISIVDFFRIADVLRDERFSPAGLRKMKTMYETTMMSLSMCLGISFVPALGISYLFSSRVRKSHSGYR
jgi:hypothetical protein